MINPALLNNTLTLQTLTEIADGAGGHTASWTDVGTFRASISPISSNERLMQDKTTAMLTHRVYCDNMDIIESDRIKWGDIVFEIMGIRNPSEAYAHLEIDVREVF